MPARDERAGTVKKIRNDIILVAVLLIAAFAVLVFFLLFGEKGAYVPVIIDGEEYGRYPLSENTEVRIVNPEVEGFPSELTGR